MKWRQPYRHVRRPPISENLNLTFQLFLSGPDPRDHTSLSSRDSFQKDSAWGTQPVMTADFSIRSMKTRELIIPDLALAGVCISTKTSICADQIFQRTLKQSGQ